MHALARLGLPLVALALGCGGGGSANLRIGTMPPGGTFHGVWQSPQYGNMHLCQSGSQVVGDYEKDERRGRIQGTVQGDVMRFQWEERRELVVGRPSVSRGRGYFRIAQGQDQDWYFQGEWGHDSAEQGGGPWNGVKMRRLRPERCTATGSGGARSTGSDSGSSWDDDESGSYGGSGTSSGSFQGGNADPALEGLDDY